MNLYHLASSTPPAEPGVLYAYRVRRYDDETGVFSPYSAIAFARVPDKEFVMPEGVLDGVITGAKIEAGVGLETYEGFVVKVTKKLEISGESIKRMVTTLFANILRNAPTENSKDAPGIVTFDGPLQLLITPEGGSLLFLTAFLPVTTTGSGPYTHTFKNLFGAKTLTLVLRIGNYLFVYGGMRVQSMSFENMAAEPTAVLMANCNIVAVNWAVYDLSADPGAYARFGMDTAGADPLPAYSGVQMLSSIGGDLGTVRTATGSVTKTLTREKGANGKRGATGHYEDDKTKIAFSAVCYFKDLRNVLRNIGQPLNSTLPVGVSDTNVKVPFSLIFAPHINGSGFSNMLTFNLPNAVIDVSEDGKDAKAVDQNVTFEAMDIPGDSFGSDFGISIINSTSGTSLLTPAAPVPNFPASAVTNYFSAVVSNSTPPTTTVMYSDTANLPSLSTLDNDPVILLKKLRYLSGVNAGLERAISGYLAPTGGVGAKYTSAAFPQAPSAGDIYTVV